MLEIESFGICSQVPRPPKEVEANVTRARPPGDGRLLLSWKCTKSSLAKD